MMTPAGPSQLPPRNSWSTLLRKTAFWFGGLYLAVVLILLACEKRLAFPGWTIRKPWQSPPPGIIVDEISIPTADHQTVSGWWLPPDGWKPNMGAVLYLHGNGQNVSICGKALRNWRNELHRGALGIDYPGYGKSTGSPDEQSCYQAAQAAFDWLVHVKDVPPHEVVVVGQSLGGAMATEVACRQRCRLLVTSGAFTSFPDIAQDRYFWLPARYLVQLRFDNLSKMRALKTPVFITHGTADGTVPFSHGERLYAAVSNAPKRFFPVADHGHSQPDTKVFYDAVRAFLAETKPPSG